MAEKANTPSRRAMLAGLAAAPVAALPGVAADVSAAPDAEEQLMTAEDFAAFEFEPWPADLLALCEPPNNDKWTEIYCSIT